MNFFSNDKEQNFTSVLFVFVFETFPERKGNVNIADFVIFQFGLTLFFALFKQKSSENFKQNSLRLFVSPQITLTFKFELIFFHLFIIFSYIYKQKDNVHVMEREPWKNREKKFPKMKKKHFHLHPRSFFLFEKNTKK